MKPKVSILIPTYNSEKTIKETLESVLSQTYPLKEVVVSDDGSTDRTLDIVRTFPAVRIVEQGYQSGIGKNLQRLMKEAQGKYVIYLCSDDLFTNPMVVSDYVSIFDKNSDIGIIGRYYYYFMDGKPGAIGTCREKNILISSCCPSGMAFRRNPEIKGSNKIFIEMPLIVAQYLHDWRWTMIEYDTVAARFHPGGNTGTKKEYFTESPWKNWVDLVGPDFEDYPSFIMIKNRAPSLLWREICYVIKTKKDALRKPRFYIFALVALLFPGFLLRALTNFYRNTISRSKARIIERNESY